MVEQASAEKLPRIEQVLGEADEIRFRAQIRDEVEREIRQRVHDTEKRWRRLKQYYAEAGDQEMAQQYAQRVTAAFSIRLQLGSD